ncbi:MAG: PAC2 family protein [Candidatus Aenigmarchaeota archaeon]|nr:PAC2 family protein [Candidatus Aenigmarchaeota archaeon]
MNTEPKNTYLVVGWADPGLVGIKVTNYLKEKLNAKEFYEMDLHGLFSVSGVMIKDDYVSLPPTGGRLYRWSGKDGDIIIFMGSEWPNQAYEFNEKILDLADQLKIKRIYTVGGIYTRVPHTRKPRISAVVNKSELKRYLKVYGIELGMDYHGPSSMNGCLIGLAKNRGIEGISLWGEVPHYVHQLVPQLPNPKVSQALLKVLASMLNLRIDFSDIDRETEYGERAIEKFVNQLKQDPGFKGYIEELEKNYDEYIVSESVESEELFKEIENFLKKKEG